MFSIDERIRGIPALREQVLSLYQSINQPHLAIPGKKAGPAQGFIVSLRATSGFGVFIYLYLGEAQDCAVYVSDKRNLSSEQLGEEESEAMGFVESMGFILDNLNFRQLGPDHQAELIKTLPVFQKDPKLAAPVAGGATKDAPKANATAALGKLFASF